MSFPGSAAGQYAAPEKIGCQHSHISADHSGEDQHNGHQHTISDGRSQGNALRTDAFHNFGKVQTDDQKYDPVQNKNKRLPYVVPHDAAGAVQKKHIPVRHIQTTRHHSQYTRAMYFFTHPIHKIRFDDGKGNVGRSIRGQDLVHLYKKPSQQQSRAQPADDHPHKTQGRLLPDKLSGSDGDQRKPEYDQG